MKIGMEKKEWKKVFNHPATAVSECIKLRIYSTADITKNHYIFTINQTYIIYYNRFLVELVPNNANFGLIGRTIMTLKKKSRGDVIYTKVNKM
jgi:hypothetical protein